MENNARSVVKYDRDEYDYWDKAYTRYRAQIEHEDTLYNQRILWQIYMQAFLFATLGLLMRVRYVDAPEETILVVYAIVLAVGLLGAAVGVIGKRVLDNAGQALDEIRDLWSDIVLYEMPTHLDVHFPHVSGGDGTIRTIQKNKDQMDKAQPKTWRRSRYLPVLFIVVWLVVIFILTLDYLFLKNYLEFQEVLRFLGK